MKRHYLKCFCLVFTVILTTPSWVSAEHEEDSWMEPDAWSRDHLTLSSYANDDNINKCICSESLSEPSSTTQQMFPGKATEDEVAFVYFKKLISVLFNRNELIMRDAKLKTYERTLIFSLQSSQLDKLEQLQDPRDLDNVLTEIFNKARSNPYMYSHGHYNTAVTTGFKAIVVDIFRDMWQLTQTSELRFLLIASFVVICGWLLHKRYQIGCFALFGGGLFLFGYLYTYLECNRELEVNHMMEILARNERSAEKQNQSGFLNSLMRFFSVSNTKNMEDQQILKKSKISLGFCRPDHVLILYFNDIFLKYLEVLLKQCTSTLTNLQESLPFPYNIFAGLLLICMIGFVLKLIFQHILSPAVWSQLWHPRAQGYTNSQPALSQPNHSNGDRLSGENLTLLLNAISAAPLHNQPMNAVSGVEEVREAIEPATPNNINIKSANSDKKSSCKIQDNNNASKEHIKYVKTEVKLEDVPDNS